MTMLGIAMRIFLSDSAASACANEHRKKQIMFDAAKVTLLRRRFFIGLHLFTREDILYDIIKP
jgi:hypothetical protein